MGHAGFNVFSGQRILSRSEKSIENLVRYIIRTSFSQERMTYHQDTGQVENLTKNKKQNKVFNALEWLVAMCTHVPNKGEQMVHYYRHYSNVGRGKRRKHKHDDLIPFVVESYESSNEFRKNWARLIQKIHEVDPLTFPKCFVWR